MKHIIYLTLAFLPLAVCAQTQVTVTEGKQLMSKGIQPSLLVEIPQVTLAEVEKDWLKYLGKESKEKNTTTGMEQRQAGIINDNISGKPFNVYSKVVEVSGGVHLTVWFTENDTVFFSKESDSERQLAVEKFVYDFGVREYRQTVQKELNNEQKKQSALENKLAGLIRAEEQSRKKIGENERSIQKEKEAGVTNTSDRNTTTSKIEDQKDMVDYTSSDPNATKGAKKTLKELENDKKKSQNLTENQGKNIDTWNKENRAEERLIIESREDQLLTVQDINIQKQKVQEVQVKLDSIR